MSKTPWKIIFLALLSATSSYLSAQSINQVTFVEKQPIIDGVLDDHLKNLPENGFPHFFRLGNPKTEEVNVTYRMAYTPSHLYLYFETDADTISYHNLGNLWGDGYKILIGKAQEGNKTSEYYDLAFSPSKDPDYWARQRVAAYNFSQPYIPLSKATQSQEKELEKGTGFEAMIAWEDLYPYHPWFVPEMGYNIYFAKGFDLPGHGYFPNGYAVVKDNGIWDEEKPKRNYAPLPFQTPEKLEDTYLFMRPTQRTYQQGQEIGFNMVGLASTISSRDLKLNVLDSSGTIITSQRVKMHMANEVKIQSIPLNNKNLAPGNYTLSFDSTEAIEREITVLPIIPYDEIIRTLNDNNDELPKGAATTLIFYLNQLRKGISELKSYESGKKLLEKWIAFEKDYQQFLDGKDPYANIRTPYRRAFQSKYDKTYQPYTINLPDTYHPDKKYPLLVFLHGSGRDEIGLLNQPRSNGEFIELAPFARDKFRAYAEDESQKDILEAIEDVVAHFSVDKENIIIGGFSMGGYGALRTFYETPELYRGVAVFAGHPNLASEWLRKKHPNFRKQQYLKDFKGVPVFIYHGVQDASLSIHAAKDLDRELRAASAEVTTRFIPDKAHEYQDNETNQLYHQWLEKVISNTSIQK